MGPVAPSIATAIGLSVVSAIGAFSLTTALYGRRTAVAPGQYRELVRPCLWVAGGLFVAAVAYIPVLWVLGGIGASFIWMTIYFLLVPWTIFALRYAGRGYLLSWPRVLGLGLLAVIAIGENLRILLTDGPSLWFIGILVLVLSLGIPFAVAVLAVLAAYRHENVPVASGLLVVAPMMVFVFAGQTGGWTESQLVAPLTAGAMVVAVGSLAAGVLKYDIVTNHPGTSTIGERAIIEELNEPILIADHDGVIGNSNAIAKQLFGDDIAGEPLTAVLGTDLDALEREETIGIQTAERRMRFDPRVSELTSARGDTLCYAVALIDVTERELQRQRIEILNRILRHNIRNNVDVVNAHAEQIPADGALTEHRDAILDTTAEIEAISREARQIEQLLGRSVDAQDTGFDLEGRVDALVAELRQSYPAGTVTVEVPSIPCSMNRELFEYALRHVIENALEYTDTAQPRVEIRGHVTPSGIQLVVADDGPGIPDRIQELLEQETEKQLQHNIGIGLWATKWAIDQLGGKLSIEESHMGGAAVRIDLPRVES